MNGRDSKRLNGPVKIVTLVHLADKNKWEMNVIYTSHWKLIFLKFQA